MKTCCECSQTKPLEDFYTHAKTRDGRQSACKACTLARRKNPDFRAKATANAREWRALNHDHHLASKRAWEAANRDTVLARRRQNYIDKPEPVWESRYRFRAKKHGVPVIIEPFTKAEVISTYGEGCYYCPDGTFEVLDHSVPIISGGPHTLGNVRPACTDCNSRKAEAERKGYSLRKAHEEIHRLRERVAYLEKLLNL